MPVAHFQVTHCIKRNRSQAWSLPCAHIIISIGGDWRYPSTLTARRGIAQVLAKQGRYEQAEQEYRAVLAARLRVLGPDHRDTRIARDSLAKLMSRL